MSKNAINHALLTLTIVTKKDERLESGFTVSLAYIQGSGGVLGKVSTAPPTTWPLGVCCVFLAGHVDCCGRKGGSRPPSCTCGYLGGDQFGYLERLVSLECTGNLCNFGKLPHHTLLPTPHTLHHLHTYTPLPHTYHT